MALHFLTILLQTGEFLRLHQIQHETQNVSFYFPHRNGHSFTNRPKSGFGFVETRKHDFDNGHYDIIEQESSDAMTAGSSSQSNESNASFSPASLDSADAADWLVFITLETLGISGWIGNLTLLIVIISSGLLERPSFIFIASLAVADIFHSTVTSCYFYPPIVLRMNIFSRLGVQFMNALDWTAWGVTLTHMIAICVDRLFAIVLFQDYTRLVTVKRTITISVLCWFAFASVNILFTSMQFCCVVVPQPEFYTFGFEDSSASTGSPAHSAHSETNITRYSTNAYKPLYVPLECFAMLILAIGNPIILFNLYEKYRRKRTLRAASVVLMEVGQSLCRQTMNLDASLARDIKIFLQITVVTVIFFAYMFIYYLFFYITEFSDKWSTMLNSICYSITHMINPVVYFSLNEQMQKQVKNMFDNLGIVKRRKAAQIGRRNALCGIPSIVHAMTLASAALSETSPLIRLSSADQEDSTGQHIPNSGALLDEHIGKRRKKATVIFEERDEMERDDVHTAFTPLLSDGRYKPPSEVYVSDGQIDNEDAKTVVDSCEFDSAVYDINMTEPCDEDVFV